ncbi:MLO-like protein 1 [Beta vulgaris subsp. vulgaris]|uniref:MLO-like protein 1 n=1 Tax=Beta vulgaris subsp. vulgaris TaxID=3555 RepID=UPI002546C8C1|nr:MLO-like protein 1 [Beta vulgaris subsp. vulgaris]
MAGGRGGPSFESTPSWVIGSVVFIIVAISWAIDKLLMYLGQRLKRKEKKHLYEALQQIKEELMLLGFVSLLLAVFQDNIAKTCIPEKLAKKWIPCDYDYDDESTSKATTHFQTSLLSAGGGRLLAEENTISTCPEGKTFLVSVGVLHELHYLIFILAIVHVVSCTITFLLGRLKISQWRKWEESIRKRIDVIGDKDRFIDIRSLTFIKERFEGVDANKRNYAISFLKHLAGIVTKADYTAMRLGFILTHCNANQKFNFHKYMVYAYEADFEEVVSTSWFLWIFVVISLTLNVAGWNIYFWLSFFPLILLLVVGTKLEQVITELAIYVAQRHSVLVGSISIHLSDEHFWLSQPRFLLSLIHVILFVNSFGFAICFWMLIKFGINSCVMGEAKYVYARILIMVVVQTICSYSTLPLYAIVTQMGSSFNEEAMERHVSGSSYHLTEDKTPGDSTTAASIQMANPRESQEIFLSAELDLITTNN